MLVAADNAPPYHSYDDNGQARGLLVEFAQEWAADFSPRFVQCPWARCLKLVASGEADVLLWITRTEEREVDFVFLDPPISYEDITLTLVLKANSPDITSPEDFDGKVIGMLRGASFSLPILADIPPENLIRAVSDEQLLQWLLADKVDAIVSAQQVFEHMHKGVIDAQKLYYASYQITGNEPSYIAISRHSPLLQYRELLESRIQKLRGKWQQKLLTAPTAP